MRIVFCGDLVMPYGVNVDYAAVKPLFSGNMAVVNLEGSILEREDMTALYKWKDKFSLYSSPQVIEIIKDLGVRAVSLCNNHILDYEHDISDTAKLLQSSGVSAFGLRNHDTTEMDYGSRKLFVVTFATYACEHSLNLFSPTKLLNEVKALRKAHPKALIVAFPHWGREKFEYPEPADRCLAHKLIDAGADLIVGHHPHVVQPVEKYKGKYIVYSIGNFILPEAYFADKYSTNTENECKGMIVRWDGSDVELYTIRYDSDQQKLDSVSPLNLDKACGFFSKHIGAFGYLLFVMRKSSLFEIMFRTRILPGNIGETVHYFKRRLIRSVRKVAIAIGLHKPYRYKDTCQG